MRVFCDCPDGDRRIEHIQKALEDVPVKQGMETFIRYSDVPRRFPVEEETP